MRSTVETADEATAFGSLLAEMLAKSAISDGDVDALRRAFYRRQAIDRPCAAEIFRVNRMMRVCHHGWTEFYLEALTNFFLEYQEDGCVLPDDSAAVLLAWLGEGASIEDLGERRLASRIFLKARRVSDVFEQRVLGAIKDNLLHRSERWLGGGRREAGVIDALDMQLIRRSIYGAGGQYPIRVSPTAVAFLFDIARRASSFEDPAAWRGLLVDAVALHLDALENRVSDDAIQACLDTWFDADHSSDQASSLRADIARAAGSLKGKTSPASEAGD